MGDIEFLRRTIGRHAHNAHYLTSIEGLTITATDAPTAPRAGISEPSLAVVVQGRKHTVIEEEVFDYASGESLVITLGLPVVGQVTEASERQPFLGFGVRLDPQEIASLLLEMPDGRQDADRPIAGAAVVHANDGLLRAAAHLVGLLDAAHDAPVLAPLYRRELLYRLITGPHGPVVRQIGFAEGDLAHIARAVHWIRDHYRETIRIDELADLAGMSSSTFHRHFRSVTRTTPIQHQKAIRLQEARLALIANPGDVAEVAHHVGYDSASQFSREYRRLFGAPPRTDAARLRDAAQNSVAVPSR
jgi:AraC-like DNA-binding protein